MNEVYIPSVDIIPLYNVIPWDDPATVYHFQTYIDAVQYGDAHFGSRYEIKEA